jgi:UDP-sulfoquinovose synthase
MIDREHAVLHAAQQRGRHAELMYAIAETNPDIHLVKLGTMGEYGTPNIDIEEGWLEVRAQRPQGPDALPEEAGLVLPLSKVHDRTTSSSAAARV